jgi:ribosomal protein S18 acetylase RimI-like enzyme
MEFEYRAAKQDDLDYLVWVDSTDEGVSTPAGQMSYADQDTHRDLMRSFISQEQQRALICEHRGKRVGLILWRYRNRIKEDLPVWSVFNRIPVESFPVDGRFCEIFQLWVDPDYRRKGIASELKRRVAELALSSGARMVYTHTESSKQHVLDLNKKLGYVELRRGPIWDGIERISLALYL